MNPELREKMKDEALLAATLSPALRAMRAAGRTDAATRIFTELLIPPAMKHDAIRALTVASIVADAGKRPRDKERWYTASLAMNVGKYYAGELIDAPLFMSGILESSGYDKDVIEGISEYLRGTTIETASDFALASLAASYMVAADGSRTNWKDTLGQGGGNFRLAEIDYELRGRRMEV